MEFKVSPIRPEFAGTPILEAVVIVHENISSVQEDYDPNNGKITAVATYHGDLTNPEIQIHQPFTSNFSISYHPLIPAVHYSQAECLTASMFEKATDAIEIGSYVILLASLISMKIAGLEFLGLLQIAYFCLVDH